MTHLNSDQTVAIDPDYFWRPMKTCPRGVKVQLLNGGGVATYGTHDGKDTFWQGWAPLPKMPRRDAGIPASDPRWEKPVCRCVGGHPDYCEVHAP